MTDRDVVDRVATLWRRAVTTLPPRQDGYKVPYLTVIKGSAAVRLMTLVRSEMS